MRFSKLSGIATGLVLTFAGQTFGHDIDLAVTCQGWGCDTKGQLCKDVPGATQNAYVCVDNVGNSLRWLGVPASWPGEPHEFALLFHDHDDAHEEIATMFGLEAPSTGMTEFEAKENRCNTEDLEDIVSDEAAQLRFYNDVSFNEDEIETIADLLLNKNNRNEDYDETNCLDLGYISLTGDAEELSLKLIEKVDEIKYYERVFRRYHPFGRTADTLAEYVLDSSSLIEEYEAPSEDKLRRRVSKYIKARGDRW